MTEVSERVPAACPSCSPDLPTTHEVLSAGGQFTVRCIDCGHVHKTRIDDRTVDRDVVVSQDGESFSASVEVPPDESLAAGEEFVLETDAGIFTVRITSLELGGEQRADDAPAEDVETIWTRDVGNVAVDVTVHPPEGSRQETYSVEYRVPGDHEFEVGETEGLPDAEVTVEGIHVREDAVGYDFDKLDHGGDRALAKDTKRVYARETGSAAWSPW